MFITRGPASLTPNVTRFHRTGTGQAICQRSPQNASRNDAVEIKHINIAILDQQGKEMGYTNNIHQKKRCDVGSVTRKGRKIDADRLDDHSAHPPTSANTALDGERQGKRDVRSTMTSIVSIDGGHHLYARDNGADLPLSSISSDDGVSSSLILFPSYKNLFPSISLSQRWRGEVAHRMLDTSLPTLAA